jgi:hypothetical protein
MGKTLVTSGESNFGSIAMSAQAFGNCKRVKLVCHFGQR